jgi:PhnB protein
MAPTHSERFNVSTSTITPYLDFAGRCEEALKFYSQALGAKVDVVMRFNESPEPTPPGMLQSGFETKVMHSSFTVNGVRLMATDGCNDQSKFDGFQLALSVATEAEAHQAFNALAADGSVVMPLCKTFWSPCFGMVSDKFKVRWMVMVPGE